MFWGSGLSEKLSNQTLLFFIFDSREQLCAEPGDCLRLVERQMVIDFASGKMTGLTSCLKDRLNLGLKLRFLCGGSNGRSRQALGPDARSLWVNLLTRFDAKDQK